MQNSTLAIWRSRSLASVGVPSKKITLLIALTADCEELVYQPFISVMVGVWKRPTAHRARSRNVSHRSQSRSCGSECEYSLRRDHPNSHPCFATPANILRRAL